MKKHLFLLTFVMFITACMFAFSACTSTKETEIVKYDITFNANSGTGTMESVQVVSGSNFTLPKNKFVAPENKFFDGFAFGGTTYEVGDTIENISENVELIAQWTKIENLVTFNANGGSGSIDALNMETNSTYELPRNSFTAPDGKVFSGWKVGETVYSVSDEITITGNTEIIAVWEDAKYTVTYTDGVTSVEKNDLLYNEAILLDQNIFTGGNNTFFAGWKIGEEIFNPGEILIVKSDVTVQPVFKNYANVSYELGDNKVVVTSVKIGDDVVLQENTFVVPEGATFAGWTIGETDYAVGDTVEATENLVIIAKLSYATIEDYIGTWGNEVYKVIITSEKIKYFDYASSQDNKFIEADYTFENGQVKFLSYSTDSLAVLVDGELKLTYNYYDSTYDEVDKTTKNYVKLEEVDFSTYAGKYFATNSSPILEFTTEGEIVHLDGGSAPIASNITIENNKITVLYKQYSYSKLATCEYAIEMMGETVTLKNLNKSEYLVKDEERGDTYTGEYAKYSSLSVYKHGNLGLVSGNSDMKILDMTGFFNNEVVVVVLNNKEFTIKATADKKIIFKGAEAGTYGEVTLDGFGIANYINDTKDYPYTVITLATGSKRVIIEGKGSFAIDLSELPSDILSGSYKATSGSTSYTFDFDGHGNVLYSKVSSYSSYKYYGIYTINGSKVSINLFGNESSMEAEYELFNDNNVIYGGKYSTKYIFVKDGYTYVPAEPTAFYGTWSDSNNIIEISKSGIIVNDKSYTYETDFSAKVLSVSSVEVKFDNPGSHDKIRSLTIVIDGENLKVTYPGKYDDTYEEYDEDVVLTLSKVIVEEGVKVNATLANGNLKLTLNDDGTYTRTTLDKYGEGTDTYTGSYKIDTEANSIKLNGSCYGESENLTITWTESGSNWSIKVGSNTYTGVKPDME